MKIYNQIKNKRKDKKLFLTRISWPIQANDTRRYTAQTTANAMQKGATASVKYETAPKKGTLTYDSPACLNRLKLYMLSCQLHIQETLQTKL